MSDLFSVASQFGVAAIFRIGLSGLILVILIFPVQNALVPETLRVDELSDFVTILIPEALILGMLLTLFRSEIYRIYEGRLLWSDRFHDALTARMKRKVEKRLTEAKTMDRSSVRYREIWYWLRVFPLDEQGDPTAVRPTLLGNILEGYETYPKSRYGMDSIFYWYRLWPTLPESFAKQAEMASAYADTFMFASMSAFLSGVAFVILGAMKILKEAMPNLRFLAFATVLPSLTLLFALGIFYIILFYNFYRASVPLHRTNGEFYKAAFDLYRNNIKNITEISEEEKAEWIQTWSYLQYMFVQCKRCKTYFYIGNERCPQGHKRRRF